MEARHNDNEFQKAVLKATLQLEASRMSGELIWARQHDLWEQTPHVKNRGKELYIHSVVARYVEVFYFENPPASSLRVTSSC